MYAIRRQDHKDNENYSIPNDHCYATLMTQFITARIRRMTGGYIFTLCVSSHLGGVPTFREWGGGTYLLSSGRGGWVPIFWTWGGGYLPSELWLGGGYLSSELWMGGG